VLFHHEPASSDADIERLFAETIRYEALTGGTAAAGDRLLL